MTIGTQPPAIASAVVMPKCSCAHGARSSSSPYPVADQKIDAVDMACSTSGRGAFGTIRTGSPSAAARTVSRYGRWNGSQPPSTVIDQPGSLPDRCSRPNICTISSCRFACPSPGAKNRPTESTTLSRWDCGCSRRTWIGG
jgi:hypothetical protein